MSSYGALPAPRERERESGDLILASFAYNPGVLELDTRILQLHDLGVTSWSLIAPEKTPAVEWSVIIRRSDDPGLRMDNIGCEQYEISRRNK